jgi:hypothetical protein
MGDAPRRGRAKLRLSRGLTVGLARTREPNEHARFQLEAAKIAGEVGFGPSLSECGQGSGPAPDEIKACCESDGRGSFVGSCVVASSTGKPLLRRSFALPRRGEASFAELSGAG